MGLDERGQLVTVPLMWNSLLVGALPRAGKTFAARLLALYCALDPYCKLSVFDAKGSPDWRKFSLVADSCAYGLTPTRAGKPPEILLATLEDLKADAQDRYTRLSEMPTDVCPEGKLTREMARDPRFRMPVRVLVLEEFQEYYELGPISKDIAELLQYLVKVAPGAGIILLCSTQKPSGIGGGGELGQRFTGFRDNFAIRFGLRTSSWQVSEMCLGQGAYSEGLDTSHAAAAVQGRRDPARRVGRRRRPCGPTSLTARTPSASSPPRGRSASAPARCPAWRSARPRRRSATCSPTSSRSSAADAGLHWAVLAERLAKRFPDRWADATADAVSAQLRSLGVPSVVVKAGGQSLRGCRRDDVAAGSWPAVSRYRATSALPAADLPQHIRAVTGVTRSPAATWAATGNAATARITRLAAS